MTVKGKKRTLLILTVLLIGLITAQSWGGQYGDQTWVAWIWLATVVLTIWRFAFSIDPKYIRRSNFIVFAFYSSLFFILVQPFIHNYRPATVLLAYLPLHAYFVYYLLTKKELGQAYATGIAAGGGSNADYTVDIDDAVLAECRRLMEEDETEKAFALLKKEVPPTHPNYGSIIMLSRKYSKTKRDRMLNVISADTADRQYSQVLNALLEILR